MLINFSPDSAHFVYAELANGFTQGVSTVSRSVIRAEPIIGSATRFGRVSDTLQYSVLSHHKPAET